MPLVALTFDLRWLEIVTKDIIYQVLDFADDFEEKYKGEGTLLIHCHEGISRSTGMALAILTYLTKDIEGSIELVNDVCPQAIPNIEIIRLTDEILKLNGELVEKVFEAYYY